MKFYLGILGIAVLLVPALARSYPQPPSPWGPIGDWGNPGHKVYD